MGERLAVCWVAKMVGSEESRLGDFSNNGLVILCGNLGLMDGNRDELEP